MKDLRMIYWPSLGHSQPALEERERAHVKEKKKGREKRKKEKRRKEKRKEACLIFSNSVLVLFGVSNVSS